MKQHDQNPVRHRIQSLAHKAHSLAYDAPLSCNIKKRAHHSKQKRAYASTPVGRLSGFYNQDQDKNVQGHLCFSLPEKGRTYKKFAFFSKEASAVATFLTA